MDASYVFLDFETSGSDPYKDQIIQVGAIKTNSGFGITDQLSCNVQLEPGKYLPSSIIENTKLTKRDLDKGVPLWNATHAVAQFIADATVVGHSVALDLGFIQDLIQPDFYCTRSMDFILNPDTSHCLKAISKRLELNIPPLDALNNAVISGILFAYYVERLGWAGVTIFKNKLVCMSSNRNRYIPPNAIVVR